MSEKLPSEAVTVNVPGFCEVYEFVDQVPFAVLSIVQIAAWFTVQVFP